MKILLRTLLLVFMSAGLLINAVIDEVLFLIIGWAFVTIMWAGIFISEYTNEND